MNKIFGNNVPDLIQIQRENFYRFLKTGITEEFSSLPNPLYINLKTLNKNLTTFYTPSLVYLLVNEIKFKGPIYAAELCLRYGIDYEIDLYISSEYSYIIQNFSRKKIKISSNYYNNEFEFQKLLFNKFIKNDLNRSKIIRIKQDTLFGRIPLMTEEGTFIIGGCERIIISQIIRSPGIYFKKEFEEFSKTNIYSATFISNKGFWTKFILDAVDNSSESENLNVKNDRIYIQVRDFEFQRKTTDENYDDVKKENDFDKILIYDLISYINNNKDINLLSNLRHPTYSVFDFLKDDKFEIVNNLTIIKKYFFNPLLDIFSVGKIGRYKINKSLGLNLSKTNEHLTILDFLGIIDGLLDLKYFNRSDDDIDNIKFKIIRSAGDLLQNEFKVALYQIRNNLIIDTTDLVLKKKHLKSFRFFSYEQPFYYLNIDSQVVTDLLKDFFALSELSQYMNQTNPLSEVTNKRRVSVFGPNGLKKGQISEVIRDIHASQYGRLCSVETSEGGNAGLINVLTMYAQINNTLKTIVTPYLLMDMGKIYSKKPLIFLTPEEEAFNNVGFCDLNVNLKTKKIDQEYFSIKTNNSFSVGKTDSVNLITISPIQILALGISLIPFLEHNDANRACMGSNMQRQAIPLIFPKKVLIGTGFETNSALDSGMVIKTYSEGIVEFSSSYCINVQDSFRQSVTYFLKKYSRSNQETCINQQPVVWVGENIFSGQIIADGPSTVDGELSLGRNLLVAYMPWEGYNYEDAILINERLITNDCLTSVHIEEYQLSLSNTALKLGIEKITTDLPNVLEKDIQNLDEQGIIKCGSYVDENSILIGKVTKIHTDNKLKKDKFSKLKEDLYETLNLNFDLNKTFEDSSLRTSLGCKGRVIDIQVFSNCINSNFLINSPESPKFDEFSNYMSSLVIKIYVAQIRKIQVGDKLSGRHGNKGVISKILPSIDMPHLPNGIPVDILLNPLGVPSRMNVGQVFECLLGFAAEKLGKRFFISPFDEIYGKEASRILINQKLKEAAIKTGHNWIYNRISPGKIYLQDGRTGEYFDNPIVIGNSYILKLIHFVESKIYARATGPYTKIFEQPVGGKSHNGGQRFGEMEVWALEAYGCANTLQELLTIKSDDIIGRNNMYKHLLFQYGTEKPNISIPESFLVLIRELNSLGLNIAFNKLEINFNLTNDIKVVETDIFKNIEEQLNLKIGMN